jgi:hypothetical protein
MDISQDITFEYVSRFRHHDYELGTVLKGHLLVEHVMNLMIEKGFKQPRVILNDHGTYFFGAKARLLIESNHLPEHMNWPTSLSLDEAKGDSSATAETTRSSRVT